MLSSSRVDPDASLPRAELEESLGVPRIIAVDHLGRERWWDRVIFFHGECQAWRSQGRTRWKRRRLSVVRGLKDRGTEEHR